MASLFLIEGATGIALFVGEKCKRQLYRSCGGTISVGASNNSRLHKFHAGCVVLPGLANRAYVFSADGWRNKCAENHLPAKAQITGRVDKHGLCVRNAGMMAVIAMRMFLLSQCCRPPCTLFLCFGGEN